MSSHVSDSNDEAARIQEAAFQLGRQLHQTQAHEYIARRAGVEIDKLSEVVMSCLVGKDNIELRLSDIARRLGVELSSVSRKVQKLEDAGWVERSSDPKDARAFHLHLTQVGKESLEALAQVRLEIFRETLSNWPHEDRKRFAELLIKFSTDLTTHLGAQ